MAALALVLAASGLTSASGSARQLPGPGPRAEPLEGQGWQGFTDVGFMANAIGMLVLATLLAVVIAYHPRRLFAADTLEEIEAPRVYIMYAVIGAIIGMMVNRYGEVVGFVVFGIGGLIRFRTDLRSASLTGQVIFVTLIGLSCGLNLPHVAILATMFGFILLYVLGRRVVYRIEVKGLGEDLVSSAAAAYREVLEQEGLTILSEKKSLSKDKITFIFRAGRHATREALDDVFDERIDATLRDVVDWEIA